MSVNRSSLSTRVFVIGFISLALSGCETVTSSIERVKTNTNNCISSAVKSLDDGKSNPQSIAFAVMGQCRKEITIYDDTFYCCENSINIQSKQRRAQRPNEWLQDISAEVLRQRNIK